MKPPILTKEEKAKAFQDYPCLDPSFEDDYNSEVNTLLNAQRDDTHSKDLKWFRELLSQMTFEPEDVHVFDTSHGYNQVRIDCVFINENSELWQAFLSEE